MSSEEEARSASLEMNQSIRLEELQQKYFALEQDRNLWFDKAKAGEERHEKVVSEKDSLQVAILSLRSDLSSVRGELQEEREKAAAIVSDAKVQQERASRVEAEADNLREEISRLTQTNKDLINQASEWETKAKLNDTAAIPLQYEVERLKKELDALSAHSRWLEEELTNRSNDLANTKLQHAEVVTHLREELDQICVERDESVSEMNRLMTSKAELERRLEKLSHDSRARIQEAADATETSERELLAERKLVDLQKEQLDRVTSRQRRLEAELESLREIANKASTLQEDTVEAVRGEIQEEANKVLAKQEAAFKKEIDELKAQINEANIGGPTAPLMLARRPILTDSGEPMGLTDVYARLNETEDELQKERAQCKKYKLYLQRIEADIATKTPLMLRQRKEHELALQRQEEMQERLMDSLKEAKALKEQVLELNDEIDRLEGRNQEYQAESKELAKQVQALLASKAGGEIPSGVPTSIAQIQKQNQQLLGEHRRLSNQVQELQRKLREDPKTIRLENAEQELKVLREDRERQEEIVKSIVLQRDLYRAIVSSQEGAPTDIAGTEMALAQHTQNTRAAEERCNSLEQDLAKARAEITVINGDKDAMLERAERATAHSNDLTVSLQSMQNELSSANATAARSKADADYHRDKCVRLEQTLGDCRNELQRANDSKKKVQALNSQLHQQLVNTKAEVSKSETALRHAEMKLRLAQTQVETSKSAESRLLGEVNQLRNELARQGALLSSVQRIEASLSAKSEEEKEKLKDELDRLKEQLILEASKHSVEVENSINRVKELEMELKEAEGKKEKSFKDTLAAKEEALVATKKYEELVAKMANMESELRSANKKLGKTAGVDPEVATLRAQVESLSQDLEKANAEVRTLTERSATFQTMAKAGELELASLSKAGEDFKKSKAKEVENLLARVGHMKEESKKKDDLIAELTKDLSSYRDDQKKSEAILKSQIAGMQGDVESARKDADSAIARAEALQAEMEKYVADATSAQRNYERELDLHAAANKDLRVARDEIASEQRLRTIAEEQLKNLKVEIFQKEKQLSEEKEKATSSVKEMDESLKQTRAQNDLLLSQLSTLGDQVDKSQGERIDAAASSETDSSHEVETLRKSVSELREVVKIMRAELELNQAKLDAAQRTAEREKAASAVTKRSLEEARAELKILHEEEVQGAGATSTEMKGKLQQAEEQVALLRDSNKLLRDEVSKMQESLESAQAQLAREETSKSPREKKEKELTLERAALVAEKESLEREVSAWKNRVQSLVSKFNQIDPLEHEKVVKEVETLKNECDMMKAQKESTAKEMLNAKALVSNLNKDLTQQKALVQKQQSLLKKMKTDKESASKTSSATAAVTTERDQLKERILKVESEFSSTKTELKGANDRIEMLKVRMRQFQKTIGEQRKKISDLEASAAASSSKAAEPKASAPSPTPLTTKPASAAGAKDGKEESKMKTAGGNQPEQPPLPGSVATKVASNETAPTVPAGGFKFGPSSTQGSAYSTAKVVEKTDVQLKPESTQATKTTAPLTLGAPPTKKAKVEDKPEDATKLESPSKTGSSTSVVEKVEEKAKVSEDKAKAAEMLKEKLKHAMALKAKLKKRKMDVESDNAQKRAALEASEQKQVIKDVGTKIERAPSDVSANSLQVSTTTKPTGPILLMKQLVTVEPSKEDVNATSNTEASKEALKEASKETPKDANKEAPKEAIMEAPKEASKEATKEAPTMTPETSLIGQQPAGLSQKSKETAKETPKPDIWGQSTPFGSGTAFGGAGTTTFGTSGFGGGGMPFGISKSIGGFGSGTPLSGGASKETFISSSGSSVFLDIKPPSSTAAPFSFGSGSSIILPTPTIAPPTGGANPFGAFTGVNPFASQPSANAKPLFGTSTSIKPMPSTDDSSKKETKENLEAKE